MVEPMTVLTAGAEKVIDYPCGCKETYRMNIHGKWVWASGVACGKTVKNVREP